jgi:hypothetical protein
MLLGWLGLASAGPLDDSLAAVDAQKQVQPGDLDRIRAGTRPPSLMEDVTTAEAQLELAVRWGTLEDARSCQRFQEMHEVLRRSGFEVVRPSCASRPTPPSPDPRRHARPDRRRVRRVAAAPEPG